jgi:DNA-directed RNA polymerase subunit RPC12/RpoP
MADQLQERKIIIRCARCGRRFFDIVSDWDTLQKESPKKMKCQSCKAMNLIQVNKDYIRVDVIE